MTRNNMIRIEKHLSALGIVSRREAKKLLEEGGILVNGKQAEAGQKINPEKDNISFTKSAEALQQTKTTVLVYKPRGVLSSKDVGAGKNIFDVFPQFASLNTVGRLDKESEGLILLSDDGMITKAITGKDHLIEKEYEVTVREEVLPYMMQKMSEGMRLSDGWTLPAQAQRVSKHCFRITLKEGRKHQIRRMADKAHLTIQSLVRIRIHTLRMGKMLPGNFKILDAAQVKDIKDAAR